MKKLFNQHGFTLIELLIVITIIATLAVSVFVALNPAQRIKDAQDARRTSDAQTLLTAIHQSIVDNKGNLPSNLPAVGTESQVGTGASGCALATTYCTIVGTACVNLRTGTYNVAKYLNTYPVDPIGGTTYDQTKTGYSVQVDANNIVTVKACATDGTAVIQASQ